MPGLFGILYRDEPPDRRTDIITDALALMTHAADNVRDPVFTDNILGAGRVHTGIVGEPSSPATSGDVHVWVDGEVYNTADLAASFAPGETTFAGVLARAQREETLESVLAGADGSFTAAVYDRKRRVVRLAGDRYGTRPLYVYDANDRFAWAGELKSLMLLDGFRREALPESAACFMSVGHLVGDLAWFGGVTLISAATVITRDIHTGTTSHRRYWSWNRIQPSDMAFEDAAGILGELIVQAVKTRWNKGVGIGLSGGLDSRTLFAAATDPARVPCYTFGVHGCWDIVIASQAAMAHGASHTVFELLPERWYDNREDDVIRTDGMQNLLHMHASPVLTDIAGVLRINLNGFFGDVIGGYFLHMAGEEYAGRRPDAALARRLWGDFGRFDDPGDPFYDFDGPDPYVLNGRQRRFSVTGSINHGAFIEQRYPFLDNRVVEFAYSLPDSYRMGGKLYHAMQLERWPDLFRRIPWQSTGMPIGESFSRTGKIMHKIRNLGHRVRLLGHPQAFTDYARWLKQSELADRFRVLLDPDNAVYPDYTGEDYRRRYLEPHLAGAADHADMICRALTLECWLRYVHNVPMPESRIPLNSRRQPGKERP